MAAAAFVTINTFGSRKESCWPPSRDCNALAACDGMCELVPLIAVESCDDMPVVELLRSASFPSSFLGMVASYFDARSRSLKEFFNQNSPHNQIRKDTSRLPHVDCGDQIHRTIVFYIDALNVILLSACSICGQPLALSLCVIRVDGLKTICCDRYRLLVPGIQQMTRLPALYGAKAVIIHAFFGFGQQMANPF